MKKDAIILVSAAVSFVIAVAIDLVAYDLLRAGDIGTAALIAGLSFICILVTSVIISKNINLFLGDDKE